jgi:cytochrome c-type biogenesis protein CcmH/NrfG
MAINAGAEFNPAQPASGLPASRVYELCVVALLIGFALGYSVVGVRKAPALVRASAPVSRSGVVPDGHPVPTMEQMKAMADVKAAPLLEKLKSDPKNVNLLEQVGAVYNGTHQFMDAAIYYDKSLQINPRNVSTRTELASNLFYGGDVDGALRELQKALKYSPNDINALFNLGMIRFKGKNDPAGAIAAWQQLLKAHPGLDRRATVEKMIEQANQAITEKN